jgi:D-alanine transaminase
MFDTFLNGDFYRSGEAMLSVDDRGFLFGDGIYEVIRFYNGSFFELGPHLARLKRSAQKISLNLPYSLHKISIICHELLGKGELINGKLYVQITRGVAPRTHEFPAHAEPTIMMKVSSVNAGELKEKQKGLTARTVHDERWNRCDIKSVSLLPNVLAKQKARSQGYYEAVFIYADQVMEGASSNVFAVLDGKLVTAPACNRILAGITRNVVIELAAIAGIKVEERFLAMDELGQISELFITSTVDEIIPILSIDEHTINGAAVGRITGCLQELFQKKLSTLARSS